AKVCLDYGIRVQKSVFECEVDPAQFTVLQNHLLTLYNEKEDSIRFYFLGKKGRQKVEHYGSYPKSDPVNDPLIF
ncbi:MAG: CRISPR-associated endonuclease Cas2, partial [Candidatus Paceibacteria bacterium]